MKARLAVLLTVVLLASGITAYAHHSFAATYDESKTITISGKVVQFSFRNPHAFVQVEVTDAKGVKARWGIEWTGTAQLNNTGVQNDTLKYGDSVEVTGNPGRNPAEHRLRLRTVTRGKDFSWGTKPGEENVD